MTFLEAIKSCLTKYVTFDGRAGRAEYWWFLLFEFVVSAVLGMFSEYLDLLALVLFLVPTLAVGARRLHDIGKTGWWLVLWFVPILGWSLMIYWAVQPSQEVSNAWGPGPATSDVLAGPDAP